MNNREETQTLGKRKLVRNLVLVFIFCISIFQPHSGTCIVPRYPAIGKEIPNFTLDSIFNYSKTKITRDDMKGQYYILDFWGSSCSACLASFPKLNQLQKHYKNQLQIFLVGNPDKVIKQLYEKLRAKNNLDLSGSYSKTLVNEFCPAGFPYLIWVDRAGIVKAITSSQDLTDKNIDQFLQDEPFLYTDWSYDALKDRLKKFNPGMPYLINGNGGHDSNFVFRSLLAKWKKGMPSHSEAAVQDIPSKYYNPGGYQILKVSLVRLYNLAYYGQYNPLVDSIYYDPILEIRDSSEFRIDPLTEEGYYCYSLILPKDKFNKENIMKFLRKDLECYFPYKAKIEERMMPCYALRVIDKERTINLHKVNEKDFVSNYMGREFNNYSTSRLTKSLALATTGKLRVFDETSIMGNINIKISALMTDIEQVKAELNKFGLDLQPTTRLMDVLVISDAEVMKANSGQILQTN